jgi:hypothetical protein
MRKPDGTTWLRGEWGGKQVQALISSARNGSQMYDYITQGVKPQGEGNIVIASWQGVPLAFYDIPTLNNMNFSKSLWQALRNDERIERLLSTGAFWGEPSHADREEIYFPDVSHRVTDFWIDSLNIVRGNIDLIDTPNGFSCYKLASLGAIGNSSRGWGNLIPSSQQGIKDVDQGSYFHVCWDLVAVPAVPACLMTIASDLKANKEAYPGMVESLRSSDSLFTKDLRAILQEELGKFISVPGVTKIASSEGKEKDPLKKAQEEIGNPPGGESGESVEEQKKAADNGIVENGEEAEKEIEDTFTGDTNEAKKGKASEIETTEMAPVVDGTERKVYEMNLYNSLRKRLSRK